MSHINSKKSCSNSNKEKDMIKLMKSHLNKLSNYLVDPGLQKVSNTRVYDSEIIDFISYTRSVVKKTDSNNHRIDDNKILRAIELNDRYQMKKQTEDYENQLHTMWILEGIMKLNPLSQKVITDRYVCRLQLKDICKKYSDISPSTLHRYLNIAYLELAKQLNLSAE